MDSRFDEKSKKRSIETRMANAKKINVRRAPRARRKPGDIPAPKTAIRAHCLECLGWETDPKDCTATSCWLYPWRRGRLETD